MDFKRKKETFATKLGFKAGYALALVAFTTALYYAAGRAGLHGISAETYALVVAAVLLLWVASSTARLVLSTVRMVCLKCR